jgi:hypothetical protein
LEKLISQSLAACLRDQPDDATLGMTVAAWARILAEVPVDQLDACYLAAWKRPEHKAGFPVTADELLAAWITKRNTPLPPPKAADVIAQLRAHRYARKQDE